MTVRSKVGIRNEAHRLWYFGDEGIKRSEFSERWNPDEITDLSAKDKLRWSKVCEWLENYFRRNPARREPQSDGQNLESLLRELEIDIESTIQANVSNWPEDLLRKPKKNPTFTVDAIHDELKGFLFILVALSLLYGGIHLATWNFAFASKTEHLLWKVACIDIMVTAPLEVLSWGFGRLSYSAMASEARHSAGKMDIVKQVFLSLYWFPYFLFSIILGPYVLFVPYVLSRIYIVVESFISLRLVPIGVYAAVPWVQAIPHI